MNDFRFGQECKKIVGYFHENDQNNDHEISIRIETPNFSKVTLADNANLKIIDFKQKDLKIKLSNESKVEINGKSQNLALDIHDNAAFSGEEFEVENAVVSSYNQSNSTIKVTKNIKAEAFDQSKMEYSGNPKNVQLSPNGESEIRKKSNNE